MIPHYALVLVATQVIYAATHTYDVVVYDASSAGVIAAVAAARHLQNSHVKGSVALLCASWPSCWDEGGRRVGGVFECSGFWG